MRFSDFEKMVRRMAEEVPPEFLAGIAEIAVSPKAVAHPERDQIYTLGECIPLPAADGGSDAGVQSRVVLYHGSFAALARLAERFDWREEAWETLTHELRHHLEWRARAPDLEALDWAVEQDFARQDGEPFDPVFYLEGERVGEGVFRVEDDVFIERIVPDVPAEAAFGWRGRGYSVGIPADATLPAFLSVEGVTHPPAGELVLVLRRKPSLLSLWRPGPVYSAVVRAEVRPDYVSPMHPDRSS